jgi:ribosomal protein L15E
MGDEYDEKVSISGDPEDALRDLLHVDPKHSRIAHDEKLDWIKRAKCHRASDPRGPREAHPRSTGRRSHTGGDRRRARHVLIALLVGL